VAISLQQRQTMVPKFLYIQKEDNKQLKNKFSASEVTTIWRYTNVYIIIIIIIISSVRDWR